MWRLHQALLRRISPLKHPAGWPARGIRCYYATEPKGRKPKMAPLQVSMDGDIYSYGVLLLEMFTGRRPTDNFDNGITSLVDYVKAAYPNNILEIMDASATYNGNTQDIIELVVYPIFRLGLACCKESPRERMKMNDVVKELNAIIKTYSAHTYS
ncbi:hypothetical protein OsI_16407 [Oryza sativa Indica Group]|uniref:Protein kinase domain-containing protein n=1 Tax=Oryza sativa subsp. indica TaxID=39946 RepID=B8AVU2_ORYSI|nr:hypothetical protein OsI_16407 [Oryza sativa Indica Group]